MGTGTGAATVSLHGGTEAAQLFVRQTMTTSHAAVPAFRAIERISKFVAASCRLTAKLKVPGFSDRRGFWIVEDNEIANC